MKPIADTDSQIDRYLRGDLSEAEVQNFARKVMNEPELMAELELRMDIIIGIRAAERRMIRERLMRIGAGLPSLEEERRAGRGLKQAFAGEHRAWWIAAAVAVAGGLGVAAWYFITKYN